MKLPKSLKKGLLIGIGVFFGFSSYAQLSGGNAFLLGDKVNVAVSGVLGREGTNSIGPGFHERDGVAGEVRCGFVADPEGSGWDLTMFDGDFFMPGTPENGWGIEIGGVRYSNNYNVNEIIVHPGFPKYSVLGDCNSVEWEGEVAGITVNVKYHLVQDEVFYTTEIKMINNSLVPLVDAYYYRSVDPDNNQSISGDYSTLNTIVSQPTGDCQKSLVSAEHALPNPSYLGFGALGDKFRVSYGGFSNRDGSDIWNGVAGLTGTAGAVHSGDEAISLAYKTDIPVGDSVNFTFAIVLSESALESAFASLYYIDYESAGGLGGGVINQCNPTVDTAQSCQGNPVTLTVDGPNAGDYDWEWTSDPFDPGLVIDGPTVVVTPTETTTYTVVGTPVSECLVSTITKTIVVEFSEGPQIEITNPGSFCEDFDLSTLEFVDINGIPLTVTYFFSEMPDSAKQVEPFYAGWPMMGPDDEVWLMIGDTAGGCFDAVLIEIDFGGLGAAGDDSTIALCGTPGTIIDLHDLLSEGANPFGTFEEITFSGQFNAATGELNVAGLGDTYEFTYTVTGVAPCPDDEATFIVDVFAQPTADFEYEVDGVSSADGLASTCIINTVDFKDFSIISGGGTITSWSWSFGDGATSLLEEPSHLYTTVGTYTITLTVSTADGCTHTYTKTIIVYTEPILDVIFNEPTCYGFSDGSITAFVAGGSGSFVIEITDGDGTLKNEVGSNTANILSAGTYYISVVDGSGCTATATITLNNPDRLEAFYRVIPPLCFGDVGHIVIDSVTGEAINNAISYYWAPVTDVINGYDADSVNVLSGPYLLTVNDSRGCSTDTLITMTQPPLLYFNEDTGYEPAYCRLYGYQNGNGVVYASASGGTPVVTYLWEDLQTGATTTNTTWGGRNPGDYRITATDANGCQVSQIITVDSLNPIADFTVNSAQLNTDLKGTANVDVVFTNTSLYFANPNNPLADPVFFWILDNPNAGWQITHDFDEQYDTTYMARGTSYTVDVCLVASNKNGCTDTACKVITVFEPIAFDGVNIFSPNGDGINDVFTFEFKSASIAELECIIVNRWGTKVGEILTSGGSWDGTDMNGDKCSDGVYFYTYVAKADNGQKIEGQNTLQIVGSK